MIGNPFQGGMQREVGGHLVQIGLEPDVQGAGSGDGGTG